METKKCARCNKPKPLSDFGENNRYSKCFSCRKKQTENQNNLLLSRYEKGIIKCVKCGEIKDKNEFYLREDRYTKTTKNNTRIPHSCTCKICSDTHQQEKIKKKEKELKDKWLGYETNVLKVVRFVGYYSKEEVRELYKRWYFETQCKYCGNKEIVEANKLNQLKNIKKCYLCRCTFKKDENLKKCSMCDNWFPNTKEYFNFYDSTIKRGGKSNYYCHTCQSIVSKKIRLNAKKTGKDIEYRKSIRDKTRKRQKEKYHNDPEFKMRHTIRNHINRVTQLKEGNEHTVDILDCDWVFFAKHIEAQFYLNMSWENHGSVWTYDHIIPLSIAKGDVKVLKELSKWWNMSPVFKINNNRKNCVVPLISTPSDIINDLIVEVYKKKYGIKYIPTEFRTLDLSNIFEKSLGFL